MDNDIVAGCRSACRLKVGACPGTCTWKYNVINCNSYIIEIPTVVIVAFVFKSDDNVMTNVTCEVNNCYSL